VALTLVIILVLLLFRAYHRRKESGPQRIKGPKGSHGSPGCDGEDGSRGKNGHSGRNGPTGPLGQTGANGLPGPLDLQGSDGPTWLPSRYPSVIFRQPLTYKDTALEKCIAMADDPNLSSHFYADDAYGWISL